MKKENNEKLETKKKENKRIQSELEEVKKYVEDIKKEKGKLENEKNNLNNELNLLRNNVSKYIIIYIIVHKEIFYKYLYYY